MRRQTQDHLVDQHSHQMVQRRIVRSSWLQKSARNAALALGCLSISACATIDSAGPQPVQLGDARQQAQSAELNDVARPPSPAPTRHIPQAPPAYLAGEPLPTISRQAAPQTTPSQYARRDLGVVRAGYAAPAATGSPAQSPVSNAYHLESREPAMGASQALYQEDLRAPTAQVQQASNVAPGTAGAPCANCNGGRSHGSTMSRGWAQCPTCTPVTIPGLDTFSLAVDSEMALRYRDEYICDGGDMKRSVYLNKRLQPSGLDQEDTIAHYKTQDGQTVVEPSTRVCIYAPRFAAVRQVRRLAMNEHSSGVGLAAKIAGPVINQSRNAAIDLHQPLAPSQSSSATKLHEHRGRDAGIAVTGVVQLIEFNADLMPFENLMYVREGRMLHTEKPRFALSVQNAITWTGDVAVQAVLDGTPAVEAAGVTGLQGTHEYVSPEGKPQLRIVKLADTDNAHPGDEIQFTLRFDNIGNQAIKEVVLLDNLATRLEYVEKSSQSTLKAKFSTEINDGESLMLRWELEEPLEVGDGGVIRFKCKVR